MKLIYRDDPTVIDRNAYKKNIFSIHVSPNNANGSTIHRTVLTRDKPVESHIWTDAVKKKTGFTPLFFKICSDLRGDFDCHPHNKTVLVGKFNPDLFSLYYAVWVSAPEVRFL